MHDADGFDPLDLHEALGVPRGDDTDQYPGWCTRHADMLASCGCPPPGSNGDHPPDDDDRPPPEPPDDDDYQRPPPNYGWIDWATVWDEPEKPDEYVIPHILPAGAAASLYAPAGAGKSLIAFEWAYCIATGRPVLGERAGRPVTVIYCDLENDRDLVLDRLGDLGADRTTDLSALHYSLLGDWPPFDTPEGGRRLLGEAQRIGADLVVIDTTARVVRGPENDSDTFRQLYRCTIMPLRRAGVAVLRLDHSGKDGDRGQRGSSAKNDDLDLIYRLSITEDGHVMLRREKNRPRLPGAEYLKLARADNPLRHVRVTADPEGEARVAAFAARLDELGIPTDWGKRRVRTELARQGVRVSNDVLVAAITRRRAGSG